MVITVCDGCAFGGQVFDADTDAPRCDAELVFGQDRPTTLVGRAGTKWWLTDHFGQQFRRGPEDEGSIAAGEVVVPPDPRLAYALRERGRVFRPAGRSTSGTNCP